MRPLPDLTDLAQSPSVFDQQTDDFALSFANEFAGTDAQQSTLDQGTPNVYAAMDPISAAIDSLGAAVDAAGSVLDLLSGDLDLVNLDPVIQDYQGYDSAIYAGIDNFAPDTTAIAGSFANSVLDLALSATESLIQTIWDFITQLANYVYQLGGDLASMIMYQQEAASGVGGAT